jgi:predicted ATPase
MNEDIIAQLEEPAKEGLIKMTEDTCSFVHDMIQQTVLQSINADEETRTLMELLGTLLARTEADREDSILFIAVDLINRVNPEGVPTDDRIRFANLLLIAGEKAIQTPDFGSACKYIESGIRFLGDDKWSSNYNISLHLFKNAALVQYAQGQKDLMMERLNEVLNNARTFEDKLDSLNLQIQAMTMDANSVTKVFEKNFSVLGQLGESFPSSPPDNGTIVQELLDAKTQLEKYDPSTITGLQAMTDPHKISAMDFMPPLLMHCYQQKSRFYPLVGARMAKMTLQYGLHEHSALGFAGLALAYATVFGDIEGAYKMGKYSLAIMTNKNNTSVQMTMHGMIR